MVRHKSDYGEDIRLKDDESREEYISITTGNQKRRRINCRIGII